MMDCLFIKHKSDTALRVLYQGNFQVYCSNCCKRWFITFNGAECSGPLSIETVLWLRRHGYDYHLPGSLEGYCNNIHKGKIRVGINSGNCPGWGFASGVTGWGVVSRLIIEEVPRSQ
ncbi:collagen triple helix repeat-containing protein 1-like [Porites lutea]|uniref:collagen triple helix repeat-containing protein 1-like n=1 Tax=Porites lutea TaxID=51062 RepID=UPI003CC5EC0F